ncbi:Na(+)-translocating NADH-quinone reductase subunit A [Candidatus Terasakiella magnetica]|uniref:Na(+)-translocating NADH-quinone reductase subunit A n=1 Tax=Candidatus Terasakiella magnetica TaxID=1867952 RepID=A0A1C3RJL3_9PROT|nr:Na(+)-translocating NADH-quinone reductase subunit A [Candidatus Terasakiella magnetica]SCA57480.1 Na(+)-translocating NADH-quinone reductase subunit A [Candidatus Terasakiella magnetica]
MRIKKGLDVPIIGAPEQQIYDGNPVKTVALLGPNFGWIKPSMKVAVGDQVKRGQALFVDKQCPDITYASPGGGKVVAINRGHRRVLESVVIELDEDEQAVQFDKHKPEELAGLSVEKIREQLTSSGGWTCFRTRPYSKVPHSSDTPRSIFVTAMDSNPLAADASVIINDAKEDFYNGLALISKLTEGPTYVCKYPGGDMPGADIENVRFEDFEGPHPAGNAGTHIHFLDPVSSEKSVWTINYQDVISIGKLFINGERSPNRVVSLAGPGVKKPRLVRTRIGANLQELTADELNFDDCRVISGSLLSGDNAEDSFSFLGRYHTQVTVLHEGRDREILGWLIPKFDKFSFARVNLSALTPSRLFNLTTNRNGSYRAMVPIGTYEAVVPLDVLPTQLLRALLVMDTDSAQALGALELDEEDLSLCSFVCHSKYNYGEALRENLTKIEKEG